MSQEQLKADFLKNYEKLELRAALRKTGISEHKYRAWRLEDEDFKEKAAKIAKSHRYKSSAEKEIFNPNVKGWGFV